MSTKSISIVLFLVLAALFAAKCYARAPVKIKDLVVDRQDIEKTKDTENSISKNCELSDIVTTTEKEVYLTGYMHARAAFIEEEELLLNGGQLNLSERELRVHEIFMRHKNMELSFGMQNLDKHAPSLHFFKAKPLIEQSRVFQFLRAMPKGAILHMHNTAAVSSSWVIGNLSYMHGLLTCNTPDGGVVLSFRKYPDDHKCFGGYQSVAEQRANAVSPLHYDKTLESKINLYTDSPEVDHVHVDKVWTIFQNMFRTLGDALHYVPAFKLFHWRLMEEMYADNVMYAELRTRPKQLYADNGIALSEQQWVDVLKGLVNEFKNSHPGFLGLKVIYSTNRRGDYKKIKSHFKTFKQLHAQYPNFVVGFDLVGQEGKGKDLTTFVKLLQDLPETAKYFFHAGETNWFGSTIDLNLVDAILMNTTRIGHGYALLKHPALSKAVKEREIAIEVSPISNQVLSLVWDLRNHPGGYFMSDNIPMVICNDDPGFWNAQGLSFDYYYAIMSMAPNNAGLKTLKNLVWSSIKYSAMDAQEKESAYSQLQRVWDDFLERVLRGDVVW